jgi:hypothetical protein
MRQQVQIQIPEPCHENWNNMSVTEQGRFCTACRKEVIDFSMMTDKEIVEHISTATRNICGRADNTQLNRVLALPPEPHAIWWKYWMGIAASFVMITSKSTAQIASKSTAQKGLVSVLPIEATPKLPAENIRPVVMGNVMPSVKNETTIRGRVVDTNGIGIAYASVTLKNMSLGVATDSTGYFTIHSNIDLSGDELLISSVGYQPKNIGVDKIENKKKSEAGNATTLLTGDIILRVASMGEVVVTGYKTQGLYAVVGGISVVRCHSSRFEKAKAKLKEILGANEIRIYPNPIVKNADFNISFNIKKPGEYTIQFIDASGKIVSGKKINIVSTGYTERFAGSLFGVSGIYFVRITGKGITSNYTAKLIVP